MIERILIIIWAAWLLFVIVAALRVFGFHIAMKRQDKRWGDGKRNQRPVALIVAVKGFDLNSTPRFFDTILDQEYENYRVIICFESWDDPVAVWLREELELTPEAAQWNHPDPDSPLRSVTLVCAGIAQRQGQKVHNQIAAFGHLTAEDEVVAFADADIICKRNWLCKLVAPINQQTHSLSTTYRWLIPKRPTLPNQVASVINASITTQGGSELTNVLWGGSMALSKRVFDEIDVPALFAGSLNDDLRLAKAARKAGHKIAFVRSLILPTLVNFNWSSFSEFAKRQYTQVKFFSPILYTGTNIVIGFYALGFLSIIAAIAYGYFFAWIPFAAAYIIDQIRAMARQQIYLSLFEENGIRQKLFAAGWLEHMLTPFWMLIHWMLIMSTWFQNKITWAGIRYRIFSNSRTQILDRPVVAERLPVGVPGLKMLARLQDSEDERVRTGRIELRPVTPAESPISPVSPGSAAAIAATGAGAAIAASISETTEPAEPGIPETPDTTEANPLEEIVATEAAPVEPLPIELEIAAADTQPITNSEMPEEVTSSPETETAAPNAPVEAGAVIPLTVGSLKSEFYESPPKERGTLKAMLSHIDKAQTKTRIQDVPSYPDKPTESAPASGSSPSSVTALSGSARRVSGGRVERKGAASRRPARSSRANHSSRARASRNLSRPVSRRASGRQN